MTVRAMKGVAGLAMLACVVAGALGAAQDLQVLAAAIGAILGVGVVQA